MLPSSHTAHEPERSLLYDKNLVKQLPRTKSPKRYTTAQMRLKK